MIKYGKDADCKALWFNRQNQVYVFGFGLIFLVLLFILRTDINHLHGDSTTCRSVPLQCAKRSIVIYALAITLGISGVSQSSSVSARNVYIFHI